MATRDLSPIPRRKLYQEVVDRLVAQNVSPPSEKIGRRDVCESPTVIVFPFPWNQGGLATAFDLAAFRLSMIAPVKKSVNHPKTVASMRGTGWEN